MLRLTSLRAPAAAAVARRPAGLALRTLATRSLPSPLLLNAPAVASSSALGLGAGLHQRRFASTFLDKADVTDRVLGCLKNFQKVDPTKVAVTSHFLNDLGLDSLDTVEVVMAFEDEFCVEIPDADAEKIHTCEDAITYIIQHPHAK